MAICIFPKLCFCFQAKANTLCYIHCRKSWIYLFFYGVHFELSKCLSPELYLRWAPLICCPKHQREICKSLRFELCTVPTFLIWSLLPRLVYWSIHMKNMWLLQRLLYWALNSMNTQVISLMITDDFSSNPKLSSLTLILTVFSLSFFMQAKNYCENVSAMTQRLV